MSESLRFDLSINCGIFNKGERLSPFSLAHGWSRATGWTVQDLEQHVCAGLSFSCGLFKSAHRCKDQLEGWQLVCLDIDGDLTIAEFWALPFAEKHCLATYTTASHGRDGLDRFRGIFAFPEVIAGENLQYQAWAAHQLVLDALGIELQDGSGRNAAGLFFGFDGTGWDTNDTAQPLPIEWIAQLPALAAEIAKRETEVGDAEPLNEWDVERACWLLDHLLPEPGEGTRDKLFIPCVAGVVAHYAEDNPLSEKLFAALQAWAARCAYRRAYEVIIPSKFGSGRVRRVVDTTTRAWLLSKGAEFKQYRIGSVFEAARRMLGPGWQDQLPAHLRKTRDQSETAVKTLPTDLHFAAVPAAPRPAGTRIALDDEDQGVEVSPPTPAPVSAPAPTRLSFDAEEPVAVPKSLQPKERRGTDQLKLEQMLRETFPGLAFNQLSREIVYTPAGRKEPVQLPLRSAIVHLRRAHKGNFNGELVELTLGVMANERPFNPVQQWLERVSKAHGDDLSILENLGTRVLGERPAGEPLIPCPRLGRPRPLRDVALERWLASAVARAYIGGCEADFALILFSPRQDIGKTLFFSKLMPPFARSGEDTKRPWASIAAPKALDAQRPEMLAANWIVILDEIDGLLTSAPAIARIKAFLTNTTDFADVKYQPEVVPIPRRCVFAGTTNRVDALKDSTGNRRFMIIEATGSLRHASRDQLMIDLDYTSLHHEQIWAAAVALFHQLKADRGWLHGKWSDESVGTYLESFAPQTGLEETVSCFVRFGYSRVVAVGSKVLKGGIDAAREVPTYQPFFTTTDLVDFCDIPVDRRTPALISRLHDALLAHGLTYHPGKRETFDLSQAPSVPMRGFTDDSFQPDSFAELEALLRRVSDERRRFVEGRKKLARG